MEQHSRIVEVKRDVEADLLQLPGVTGVGVGYKYVDGRRTDEVAVQVFVAEKGPVPPDEEIPREINGVKTDVIERRFVLHPLAVPLEDVQLMADTGTYDPLKGGISIGPCRAIGGFVYSGTLGAVVTDNATGKKMLLSNFHVMCVNSAWSVGDTMAQPSRGDTGSCPGSVVGKLQRASLGGQVDCAVASHEARGAVCEIVDIGKVAGTGTAALGMKVRKRGRTTGLTYGIVDTVALTIAVDYGFTIGSVTLTNQIGIKPDTAKNPQFGNHGDSGSVVVDDSRKVVGLYFAGSGDGYGVANPIQAVLTALNVKICVAPSKSLVKDVKDASKFEVKEIEIKQKFEKVQIKEIKIEKLEQKEWFEKLPDFIPDPGGGLPPIARTAADEEAGAGVEERLAQLEQAVGELTHFIASELRPDLTQGALSREPDHDSGERERLAKEASRAKYAKDQKDAEKPRER